MNFVKGIALGCVFICSTAMAQPWDRCLSVIKSGVKGNFAEHLGVKSLRQVKVDRIDLTTWNTSAEYNVAVAKVWVSSGDKVGVYMASAVEIAGETDCQMGEMEIVTLSNKMEFNCLSALTF